MDGFFSLTRYGPPDTFKDMVRPDWEEPTKPPNLIEVAEKGQSKKSFSELIKQLDVYTGFADGYAYKSNDRLKRLRLKGVFKPVGPMDMYKYPGATSMDYGWWTQDPCLTESWYKPDFHPVYRSEMSRYYNDCMKIDKYFKL